MSPDNRLRMFGRERQLLSENALSYAGLQTRRFYNLDHQVYQDGALPSRTKELMGLVTSLVLRCDDCIMYHLSQCHEIGISDDELEETLTIGLIVGGSITIPHIRRIWDVWREVKNNREGAPKNRNDHG